MLQATEPVKAGPPGDQTAVNLPALADQLTGVPSTCPDPSVLIWSISLVPVPQLPTSAVGMSPIWPPPLSPPFSPPILSRYGDIVNMGPICP